MFFTFLASLLILEKCASVTPPPRTELKPILLDSFIPATMQIIAHITELMKYDLKPTTGTTTTTTVRPTRPHSPGIFAPEKSPGSESYYAKTHSYEVYVEMLQHSRRFDNGNRYRLPLEESRSLDENKLEEVDLAFGNSFGDVFRLVNKKEDVLEEDEDRQVQRFAYDYDDQDLRYLLIRQKKKPPTRAYVTLLSLYDLLNKESKKLGLNKYNGYAQNILSELVEISTGTSAGQLRSVLSKVVQRMDTKNSQVVKKINNLLKDLEESNSYINAALRYIPPLPFSL